MFLRFLLILRPNFLTKRFLIKKKKTSAKLSNEMFSAEASPHGSQVGLSDWARYGENGRHIPDYEMNYPYKLVFRLASFHVFVK